eukprot:COSAG04_NODE_154_length_22391_cov_6.579760_3_plen_283_part_00
MITGGGKDGDFGNGSDAQATASRKKKATVVRGRAYNGLAWRALFFRRGFNAWCVDTLPPTPACQPLRALAAQEGALRQPRRGLAPEPAVRLDAPGACGRGAEGRRQDQQAAPGLPGVAGRRGRGGLRRRVRRRGAVGAACEWRGSMDVHQCICASSLDCSDRRHASSSTRSAASSVAAASPLSRSARHSATSALTSPIATADPGAIHLRREPRDSSREEMITARTPPAVQRRQRGSKLLTTLHSQCSRVLAQRYSEGRPTGAGGGESSRCDPMRVVSRRKVV